MELNHGVTACHKRMKSLWKAVKNEELDTKKISKHQDEDQIKPSPSMVISKTNCHAAVINARLGRPL